MTEESVYLPEELGLDAIGDRESKYGIFREYYDGDHNVQLTERQMQYLNIKSGGAFRANYCPICVDAVAERLKVTGFASGDQSDTLWDWWTKNRMDYQQGVVHLSACRDGDTYLMVEWDEKKGIPRFSYELAYDGDEGVKCHYSKERRGVVSFASKRWTNDSGDKRLNIYWPDVIHRYVKREGDWQPYSEDGNGSALTWIDSDGYPLGVPIIHFRNKGIGYNYGKSELKDITPLQDGLNKAIVDLVAAADTTAFRIYYMLGDDPSGVEVAPGVWIHSAHPPTGDEAVEVGYFPGEDLENLIGFKDAFVVEVARISRTPLSYFQVSSYRAAEGTLKQEESGLVEKVKDRQTGFGNSWEDAMMIARKLWNTFGDTDRQGQMDEDQAIETIWQDPETRNDLVVAQTLQIKREALHIPLETLWAEGGYSPQQIQQMMATDEYKNYLEMQKIAVALGGIGAEPEGEGEEE